MNITTYFEDFLSNIRLTDELITALANAHKDLREHLKTDDKTKDLLVDSFLQGSYARSTSVMPKAGDKVDVDVIAVTNINHNEISAEEAFEIIIPFVDRYYEDYKKQRRSIGIFLPEVDVDLVITAAPSEEMKEAIESAGLSSGFTVQDLTSRRNSMLESYRFDALESFFGSDGKVPVWKEEPLLIPDREDNLWDKTHPLEQISWTKEFNKKCNGHFINVVKAIKWWKSLVLPDIKHPKSYPLERFIGECCPEGIESVAEGIVKTFRAIVSEYPEKPVLPDRGVPEHDVFDRLSKEEYQTFYKTVVEYLKVAEAAYTASTIRESVEKWREFFLDCDEFPPYDDPHKGFTPRDRKSENIPTGRFG